MIFYKAEIPRPDRIYHQTKGNSTLSSILSLGTIDASHIYKVCETMTCTTEPVSSVEKIETALRSRWTMCMNIHVGGNEYVLHPSREDTYFVAGGQTNFSSLDILENYTVKNYDELQIVRIDKFAHSHASLKDHLRHKTYLAAIDFHNIEMSNVREISMYPEFYYPILLSALLPDNRTSANDCVKSLAGRELIYYEYNNFSFLGDDDSYL